MVTVRETTRTFGIERATLLSRIRCPNSRPTEVAQLIESAVTDGIFGRFSAILQFYEIGRIGTIGLRSRRGFWLRNQADRRAVSFFERLAFHSGNPFSETAFVNVAPADDDNQISLALQ